MGLSALPSELLLQIAGYLDDTSLGRLSSLGRRFNDQLFTDLHRRANAPRIGPSISASSTTNAIDWAVLQSKTALVRYLLEHGNAGVDGAGGPWPLYTYVTSGRYEQSDIIYLFVVKAGTLGRLSADEATRVLDMMTCLACKFDSQGQRVQTIVETIELLLSKYSANPTANVQPGVTVSCAGNAIASSFLHRVVRLQSLDIFKLLVQHGANLSWYDRSHDPILLEVIYEKDITRSNTQLSLLLAADVDRNLVYSNKVWDDMGDYVPTGQKALRVSLLTGRLEAAVMLIEAGVSVSNKYYVRRYGSKRKKKFLSATNDLCEALYRTPPDETNARLRLKCVHELLQRGADARGYTTVEGGLRRGALVIALCGGGPLAWARERVAIAELLIQHGADAEEVDASGRNALVECVLDGADIYTEETAIRLSALTLLARSCNLPKLLPGEYILGTMESALQEAHQVTNEQGGRVSEHKAKALETPLGMFRPILEAYEELGAVQIGSLGEKLRSFWEERQVEIVRNLEMVVA